MGAGSGERGAGGGGADRARRGRELAAGGPRGGRGARRNRPAGRGDCGRGGRGILPREADGQHRLRSVVAKADDAGVRRAGAGGAAAAPPGREVDDPMPRMPTNSGEPMEEFTPLDPSVAPPYNLIAERLFRARTVIISGEITQRVAAGVMAQLLALAGESSEEITVFINSQGGHVEAGDTIHDLVRFLSPRVRMVGTGWVASIAALIYVAVPREDRYCLPNTRFLLHQPAGGPGRSASDIEIEARESLKMRDPPNRGFAPQTGQPLERIKGGTPPHFRPTAQEARSYRLIGPVTGPQSEDGLGC